MRLFDQHIKATIAAGLALLTPIVEAASTCECEEKLGVINKRTFVMGFAGVMAISRGHSKLGLFLVTAAVTDFVGTNMLINCTQVSEPRSAGSMRYSR